MSPLFFAMFGDIDVIFGIWMYNDELQIKFTFRPGRMIFGRVMALGLWNLAKYLVVTTLFHYDLRYWLDFWYELECIIAPYIRMLDSDWLIAVIFFTNSGLALWFCRIFNSCRCICIRFNFFSWYLQSRICRFYPSPRRL